MTLPLVSVLVPCFNHERYLTYCLDSILRDGYPNIEIRWLDDGSTDSSPQLAKEWLQVHAHLFKGGVHFARQTNRGIVATLNCLARDAKGDYLAILASDDALVHESIQRRVSYLQRHPALLAVFGDATVIDEAGRSLHQSAISDLFGGCKSALRTPWALFPSLAFKWGVPGPVFLCSRAAFERFGPYEERYTFEDRPMYMKLAFHGTLGFLDHPVAEYRLHPHSSTGTFARALKVSAEIGQMDKALFNANTALRRYVLLISSECTFGAWHAAVQDRAALSMIRWAFFKGLSFSIRMALCGITWIISRDR